MINGAKWWKFDFHVHTPGSTSDYREANLSPRNFLLSAMINKIDCIAITDHNSCDWFENLTTELTKMKTEQISDFREIILFPGFEVDVSPNTHLLGIFDPNKKVDKIKEIISVISNLGDAQKISDSIKSIQQEDGIAIPAHVNDIRGLFTEVKGSELEKVMNNCDFFAVETTDVNYNIPQLCVDKKRNYTFVMGSDAHRSEDIGKRFSWVKMDLPNIESLALALQDGSDGIISEGQEYLNPNNVDSRFYIEQIEISNGQGIGNGNPLKIKFSPWLNTLIGGRGSGKTAIVEFLRTIFNQTDNMPKEIMDNYNNFIQVPKNKKDLGMFRENTKLEVIVNKDCRRIKLKWENKTWTQYEKLEGNWKLNENVGDVNQRFPINIYSQKQLYKMAEEPKCLLQYIDSLLDLDSWNHKFDELKQKYFSYCSEKLIIEKKLSEEESLRAKQTDINAKIEMLEKTSQDPTIKIYQDYQLDYKKFQTEISSIQFALEQLQHKFEQSLLNKQQNMDNVLSTESLEKYNQFISDWSHFIEQYIQLQTKIPELLEKVKYISKNHDKSENFIKTENQYNNVVSELKEKGVENIDELKELCNKRQEINKKIENLVNLKDEYEDLSSNVSKSYKDIIEHQKLLRKMRETVISKINSEQIKITLLPLRDIELAEHEFRNIIHKDTQYQNDIYDIDNPKKSFLGLLCSSNCDIWQNRENIINNLFDHNFRNATFGRRFSDHIATLIKDSPEEINKLKIWVPSDTIDLEIKIGNKFKNIAQGSAGQKATGLLTLILQSNNGPIIIDQPEDDLDTQLITNTLVEELRKLKKQTQIIVVTHNPNIPVNGAAEQVLAMHFVNGQINCKCSGALQRKIIRNEICEIMEGGCDALKNRYYRIYKPLNN